MTRPSPSRRRRLAGIGRDGHEVMEPRVHLTVGLTGPAPAAVPAEVQPAFIPMATGDFDGDGWLDMAVAKPDDGGVTIRLGNGDGTFRDTETIGVGMDVTSLSAVDLNGDGRLDLVLTDAKANAVDIFYGVGDGSFLTPQSIPVGSGPSSMTIGDFNDDGHLDIAVANSVSDDVSLILSRGDGTFLPAESLAVGQDPVSIISYDFNGDGRLDMAVANHNSGDVSFLLNDGGGNFHQVTNGEPGMTPESMAMITLNSQNAPHLFVADANFDATWDIGPGYTTGSFYRTILGINTGINTAADFNNDGHIDVASVDTVTDQAVIYLIAADGDYTPVGPIQLSGKPSNLLVGDFNGDGDEDLAIAYDDGTVDVRLGLGNGSFLPPQETVPSYHASLQVIQPEGGGPAVAFSLDDTGRMLIRTESSTDPGQFLSPTVLNPSPEMAIRDFAAVRSSQGVRIAALLSRQSEIQIYQFSGNSVQTIQTIPLAASLVPTRIISGDLENDGRDDLIVLAKATNQVLVLYQNDQGQFSGVLRSIDVCCESPSDLTLADVDDNGYLDVIVSDESSGSVCIIRNLGLRQFDRAVQVAGAGPSGQDVSVVAGDFGPGASTDLAIVDHALNGITVVNGISVGQSAAEGSSSSYATGDGPSRIVAGDFTGDGLTDLAVLNEAAQSVTILIGEASGGFAIGTTINVGYQPVDLVARDLTGDGKLDLLVSDQSGDLLTLLGHGDGTFAPIGQTDQVVSLAAGINLGGGAAYVLSDASQDQVSIKALAGSTILNQTGVQSLLGYGDLKLADLNGDGISDLIVANTADNDVQIYLGQGGGYFNAPLQVYVGTAPVGITVAELDGDSTPEILVANSGSNDVSVLFPVKGPSGLTIEQGPRLKVGDDPVSTTVVDADGDGIPDLLVTNQGDDTVSLLHGLGGGFFDDAKPSIFKTGPGPIDAFAGHFSNSPTLGLVAVNSSDSSLTYYSDVLDPQAQPVEVPTGGIHPVLAVDGGTDGYGYSEIIVAHDGDSRITAIAGSPAGPFVLQFVDLSSSQSSTSIVVDASATNAIHISVSTAGDGTALPYSLSSALGLSNSGVAVTFSTSPAGGRGPLDMPTITTMTSMSGSVPLSTFVVGSSLFGTPNSNQGGLGGFANLAANIVTSYNLTSAGFGLGYTAQSAGHVMASTIGSFSALISDLMQLTQTQVSDVLPLESSSMATVAVLLTVNEERESDAVDASEEIVGMTGLPGFDGPADVRRPAPAGAAAVSPTDRFVSGVDLALGARSRDLNGSLGDDVSVQPIPRLNLFLGGGRAVPGKPERGDRAGNRLDSADDGKAPKPIGSAASSPAGSENPSSGRRVSDGETPAGPEDLTLARSSMSPVALVSSAVAGLTLGWKAMAQAPSAGSRFSRRPSFYSRKHMLQGR